MGFDEKGQFWISNHSMGIDIYNWQKPATIKLSHDENNPKSIPDGIIFSIFCDLKKTNVDWQLFRRTSEISPGNK